MEIIGVIVAGLIIGLLGKFVAPGDKDNIPLWLTLVCGIGGVILGWFIYTAFAGNGSPRLPAGTPPGASSSTLTGPPGLSQTGRTGTACHRARSAVAAAVLVRP